MRTADEKTEAGGQRALRRGDAGKGRRGDGPSISGSPGLRVSVSVLCLLFLPGCFDNTKIEQQRAEIERLRQEANQLKQEAEAIRQQGQQEDQERAACNQAFSAFAAARKTTSDEEAITQYREGLRLCPSDDVAHNELGEIYQRLGRRAEAASEFHEALRLNPNFSRAQKNLDATR